MQAHGFDSCFVTGQGCNQIVIGERVQVVLDVIHHRHLLVHEVASDKALSNHEIGHTSSPPGEFRKNGLLLVWADLLTVAVGVHEVFPGHIHLEFSGEVLEKCLVESPFSGQLKVIVGFRCAPAVQANGTQQHRCSRSGSGRLGSPSGHAPSKEKCLNALFFEVLLCLATDRSGPLDGFGH